MSLANHNDLAYAVPGEEKYKMAVQDLLPGYRATMEAYMEAMTNLGLRLVGLLALALRLPRDFFDDKFKKPMTFLRPLHYTDDVSSEREGLFAAGLHC